MRAPRISASLLLASVLVVACGGDRGVSGPSSEAASIAVSPEQSILFPRATRALSASVRDAAGKALASPEVTWSSSDEAVATVDAAGVVTAVAPGTALITASSGERTGTSTVTVQPPVARIVFINVPSRVGMIDAKFSVGGTDLWVRGAVSDTLVVTDLADGEYAVSLSATPFIEEYPYQFLSPEENVVVSAGEVVRVDAARLALTTTVLKVEVTGIPDDVYVMCSVTSNQARGGRATYPQSFPRALPALQAGLVQIDCDPVTIDGRVYEQVQPFSENLSLSGFTPQDATLIFR